MPIYNKTFEQWLNDVTSSPIRAPQQAVTAVFDKAKNKYIFLKYTIEPPSNDDRAADVQFAIAIGDSEEIRDLKGVETAISLGDLATNPTETVKKLLENTQNDILNIDELGAVRSSMLMGNIVRGKTHNEDGTDLTQPTSVILRAMGVKYPSLVNGGVHEYQLMVDSSPTQPRATYADRRSVELGESLPVEFQTYTQQSNAMYSLAESAEDRKARPINRNNAFQSFNRTALRELELSLTHSFDHKIAGGKSKTGELTKFFNTHGALPSPADPNYNTIMSGIVGVTAAEFADPARFSDATKKYLHSVYESEIHSLKINGDAFLGGKINTAVNAQLGFSVGAFPATMSPDVKKAWEGFIGYDPVTGRGKPISVKNRMAAYDGLRDAYLKEGRVAEWRNIAVQDLGLEIDTRNYGGIRMTRLYGEDLNFMYQRKLIDSYMLLENNTAQIRRDVYNAAVGRSGNTNDGRLALERFDASINGLRLSNNLYFASTTKEILEAIRGRKFISVGIIATRFFNAIPYIDPEFRNLDALTNIINPDTYLTALEKTDFVKGIGEKVFGKQWLAENKGKVITGWNNNVAMLAGIGFETGTLPTHGVIGLATKVFGQQYIESLFENRQFIMYQHYRPEIVGGVTKLVPSGIWATIGAKASQVKGLFGDESVYELLSEISSMDMLNGVMAIKVDDFIANPANLQSLSNAIQTVSTSAAGYAPLNAFEQLAIHLGFGAGGARQAKAAEFLANFNQVLGPNGAMAWLQAIAASGKVPQAELWTFLQATVQSGKTMVGKNYLGPLNIFNRYANLARDFLYKNFIWGKYLEGAPGVSMLRGFLKTLGMSEDIGLIMAAQKWRWVRWFNQVGNSLNRLSQSGGTSGAWALRTLVGRKLGSYIAVRVATSTTFRAIAQTMAYVFKGVAGIATGGISFVLTTLGSIAFQMSLKLMKGDLRGAGHVVEEELTGLANVAKIVVVYPLTLIFACGCGCFMIVMLFLVVVVPGMMAPNEDLVAGISGVVNSELIEVDKNSSFSMLGFGSTINYEITVRNTSDAPVTISTFSDELRMVGPCTVAGSPSSTGLYGEPGFKGKLSDATGDIPALDYIEAQFLGKIIPPGEEVTYEFSLYDYGDDPATFYNSVEVAVAEEPGKSAIDSTADPVNGGGCSQCPSGWPVTGGSITQGPNGGWSHTGVEATDISVPNGTLVRATHDGVVTKSATGWNDGYGTFIEIQGAEGYRTLYGHLLSLSVDVGDTVIAGQEIGFSDNSGNSTGPHLHYEFRRPLGTCNGIPFEQRPPFVPRRY
jgi:hypothetical protein